MKKLKFLLVTAGLVALMGAILAPNATADDCNEKTVVTFNAPAGTYVFKIMDSLSDRVQIFSADVKTI